MTQKRPLDEATSWLNTNVEHKSKKPRHVGHVLGQSAGAHGNVQHDEKGSKAKPSREGQKSHSSADLQLPTPASHRVTLLTQLLYELQRDSSFARELTHVAGPQITQTAVAFAQSASATPSLAKLIPLTPPFSAGGFPNIEPGCAYPDPVPNPLPSLPPIKSEALASGPFIHRGVVGGQIQHNSGAVAGISYERLEFLGDAYLELIGSRLLYHHFPADDEKRLSSTRERLLTNATLGGFSLAYGFDARVQVPANFVAPGADRRKAWTKLLGDVFEAYVAAVIVSDPAHGFATVERWMAALWTPAMSRHEAEVPVAETAKQELAKKICSPRVRLDYDMTGSQEFKGGVTFAVEVRLTGWGWERERLGAGKGTSRNEAGARAAMNALQNPLTAQLAATKRKYDELVRAEREKEGGPDQARLDELEETYKKRKT